MPHVLHEVGVVDARRPQPQQPRGGQPGKAHRAGRGNDQLVEAVPLDVLDDFQERREGQRCDSYSGMGNVPTGGKFFRSILVSGIFRRLVSTTSLRPVLRAVSARIWIVRLTPLTSAKVSVIQALCVARPAEVGRRGKMGGHGLVEPLVLVLRVEGRQVRRHAQAHRASEATVCRLSISGPCRRTR